MAGKKKITRRVKPTIEEAQVKPEIQARESWLGGDEAAEPLDPQEEKVLDIILKAVVGFILAWLGLSILLVIGGYFHLWK